MHMQIEAMRMTLSSRSNYMLQFCTVTPTLQIAKPVLRVVADVIGLWNAKLSLSPSVHPAFAQDDTLVGSPQPLPLVKREHAGCLLA